MSPLPDPVQLIGLHTSVQELRTGIPVLCLSFAQGGIIAVGIALVCYSEMRRIGTRFTYVKSAGLGLLALAGLCAMIYAIVLGATGSHTNTLVAVTDTPLDRDTTVMRSGDDVCTTMEDDPYTWNCGPWSDEPGTITVTSVLPGDQLPSTTTFTVNQDGIVTSAGQEALASASRPADTRAQ